MTSSFSRTIRTREREPVLLAGVQLPPETDEVMHNSMEELARLVDTVGGKVVDRTVQKRYAPDPATFIGRGKAEEIAERIKELGCNLVVFDNELSGGQQENLEQILKARIVDRTGVILDIFAKHARSKEAKRQVEMATLQYVASRLTRRWTHLGRQKGGIGLRGLGEKQIELDRRQIRSRLARLKKEVEHSAQDRATQRSHRDKFLRVAIVGYTNAGKSTLMNALTTAEVLVDDQLFATLDSTVRIIDPKTRPPILLSDTVGFIKKLPHTLVASFRSTLQEVIEADLLLHVVDLSSPTYEEEIEVTKAVLEEIGAGAKPRMLVFNKVDQVKDFLLPKLLARRHGAKQVISALNPEDAKRLREAIYEFFEKDMVEMTVILPYSNTYLQSQVHQYSKVLETRYVDDGVWIKTRIMRADANRLKLGNYLYAEPSP
ncbi:MAG: GTPase HflX [Bdellovibrionales bacterium]|nr:GTPase HflX [Bdellovibrionales bacterium]